MYFSVVDEREGKNNARNKFIFDENLKIKNVRE